GAWLPRPYSPGLAAARPPLKPNNLTAGGLCPISGAVRDGYAHSGHAESVRHGLTRNLTDDKSEIISDLFGHTSCRPRLPLRPPPPPSWKLCGPRRFSGTKRTSRYRRPRLL